MKSIKQYSMGGCSVGTTYGSCLWSTPLRYHGTYIPSFMKIGIGIQAILTFYLRNLRDCNVGITDGRDLWITPLRWTQGHDIHTKFYKYWFRYSKINRGIHMERHRETHRQQGDIISLLLFIYLFIFWTYCSVDCLKSYPFSESIHRLVCWRVSNLAGCINRFLICLTAVLQLTWL
jgi:hypothetical protein